MGAGVLFVIGLFFLLGERMNRAAHSSGAVAPHSLEQARQPPASSPLAEQAVALETEIEHLDGAAKVAKQRELVTLLMDAGYVDRAAMEQQQVAEALDTAEAWRLAGDLFYGWMRGLEKLGQTDPAVAQRAVAAYQRFLAAEPDNLDARTDLASAYLGSNEPMRAVDEIKRVLEADPEHVQARYNYGVMLARIGRMEQAIKQFEHVKTYANPGSLPYRQAEEAIRLARESTDSP